ncbi:dihydrofolate reductase family protein [Glycomyces endophyticus]|uniref:Dihydrofolate reductase family protein n=1 Tax=Glycomyces endophyticus TaxID=480996 RepID=A0ABP4TZ75_9ACTN
MGALRYSINTTLDGCCAHDAMDGTEEMHRYAAEGFDRVEALLFGRVVYSMMEEAWRLPPSGETPEWMQDAATVAFARRIDAMPKYVVSSTLDRVDWNAELVHGDLADAVRRIKAAHEGGVYVGGVTLPLALAGLGLIDEYEFIVHPRIAGRGPAPFAGLTEHLDLELVQRREFLSGATALRFVPKR